jgi:hypothetical protein
MGTKIPTISFCNKPSQFIISLTGATILPKKPDCPLCSSAMYKPPSPQVFSYCPAKQVVSPFQMLLHDLFADCLYEGLHPVL